MATRKEKIDIENEEQISSAQRRKKVKTPLLGYPPLRCGYTP